MNSMLAKHCNNHCSKKSTKTCPSYVTKEGSQTCERQIIKRLKHELGSRAGLSLLYTAQRIKTGKILQKLDLQDNNNYMCMFIFLLVQFAYMSTFFLKQMRFAPSTLLDTAKT